ncbi:MAG: FtsQ-type POTRA domain-containing protein [Mailhella sp.]|nr:FtsQ-type POTRA domain-containing protein [Mailhella sp.]
MAIGSERKNRRVPYEPKGRPSVVSAAKNAAGGKNVRKKGNVKKAAEAKKPSRKKKRRGLSLPSLPFSSQGFWRFLRWSLALSLIGFLMFGAAVGLLKAWRFCVTSPYFAITDIQVSGNSQVRTSEVLEICGIREGANSMAVRIHDAEQELVKNPWVESVSIRRELPGTFIIKIKEREPAFFAKKDQTLFFLNIKGQFIAPVTSRNYRSLPMLELGPGGDDMLPMLGDFSKMFESSGFPFRLSQISWVRLSAASGFELYWEPRRMHLAIGFEGWQENLKRMASVVSDVEKRKETERVSSIRAADGQVWMTRTPEEKKEASAKPAR